MCGPGGYVDELYALALVEVVDVEEDLWHTRCTQWSAVHRVQVHGVG